MSIMEANTEVKENTINDGQNKADEGKLSRPGSSASRLSLKSAMKIYSGMKFFDVKRPSSRSSVKSRGSNTSRAGSKTSRVESRVSKLTGSMVKLSRSTSHLGSTATLRLGNNASLKLGSISSRLSSNSRKLTPLEPIKFDQKPINVEQRSIDFRTEVQFVFSCDLCSEDDKNKPAKGFCTVCNQYMCNECLTFHQRVNATKSHPILIGEHLQKTTPFSGITSNSSKSNCSFHPGEILKYFCYDHEACICEKCKFIQHTKCEDITNINELATGMHERKETKAIVNDIDAILKEFKYLKQARVADLEEINAQKEGIINSINTTRKQFNELLDKIQSDTLRIFSDSISAEINAIQKQTETFDSIIPLLETHKADIVNLRDKAAEEDLFLAVKNATKDIKHYCGVLLETHKDSYKFNMKFEVNETLKEFYQNLESLGLVRIKKFKTGCILPSLTLQPHSEREALFAGEVNVYFQTDTAIPAIYKILELPDGELLITDTANKKLKLFDYSHTAICEMTLTSEPKGVTFLAPSEVLVALNKERCLQRVVLNNDTGLTLGRKCFTKLHCIDLVSHDKDLVALAENKSKFFVIVMDAKGRDKKCVWRDSKKTGIFMDAVYINKNKAGTIIYVSDSVRGCYAISIQGDIIFHISDNGLDDYRGICVNPEGGIYIAGSHSNSIVLFSDKGQKVQNTIVKNLFSPCAVHYSTSRNQLIISYMQANTMKLFTLL